MTAQPASTVSAEELRGWASEHVPHRAAAAKDVVLVDTLSLTNVGRPCKAALRLDATRHAVVAEVGAVGVGDRTAGWLACGVPVTSVPAPEDQSVRGKVAAGLDRYALASKFTAGS